MHILRHLHSLEVCKNARLLDARQQFAPNLQSGAPNPSFHTQPFTCALARLLPDISPLGYTKRLMIGPGRAGPATHRNAQKENFPGKLGVHTQGKECMMVDLQRRLYGQHGKGLFGRRPSIIKSTDSISQPSTAVACVQACWVHVHSSDEPGWE